MVTKGDEGGVIGSLGLGDINHYIHKTDKQQGPTV